jgi:hypothetical protein
MGGMGGYTDFMDTVVIMDGLVGDKRPARTGRRRQPVPGPAELSAIHAASRTGARLTAAAAADGWGRASEQSPPAPPRPALRRRCRRLRGRARG